MPDGRHVRMRVRLCWRRDGRNLREDLFSAFQLRARTLEGDWERTLQHVVERDATESVTHALALQRDGDVIVYAALIPSDQLPAIWQRQREVSDELIARGAMGRAYKNHATNGDSPTMWLQDERTEAAHEVSDALWNWPGVIDLATLPASDAPVEVALDDTWDDVHANDYSQFGSDGAKRRIVLRSSVKRDAKVRKAVIHRSKGCCERLDCGVGRDFSGFLDVHHILGVEKSDRVWNCVALCPNCHRESHFGPDFESINAALLQFANQFGPAV